MLDSFHCDLCSTERCNGKERNGGGEGIVIYTTTKLLRMDFFQTMFRDFRLHRGSRSFLWIYKWDEK